MIGVCTKTSIISPSLKNYIIAILTPFFSSATQKCEVHLKLERFQLVIGATSVTRVAIGSRTALWSPERMRPIHTFTITSRISTMRPREPPAYLELLLESQKLKRPVNLPKIKPLSSRKRFLKI